jgi:hypothetical protein
MRGIQGRRECKPRRTNLQARLGTAAGATTAPDYPRVSEAATILTPTLPSFVTAIGHREHANAVGGNARSNMKAGLACDPRDPRDPYSPIPGPTPIGPAVR